MKNILTEKEFQRFFLDRLKENGYEIWPSTHYDRLFALNRQELFRFLNATQPETMKALNKIYKAETENTIVAAINAEETKERGSRLSVLKYGLDISNMHLDLLYTRPATSFNQELNKLYDRNIFSVSEEVWASDNERIDLVIFLNGLAIMTFELKANTAGQNYRDAILQYRTQRNPKTRLFRFKAGVLVNFAMDLEEVYMTTKVDGESTYFLPFNMGNGEGINAGAGNPIFEDKYSVHYMWENVLRKDSVLEIITKFMFIELKEKVDEKSGKTKTSETVLFPRYHQLDVVRELLDDVKINHSSQNYLLQHSAGSGKTYEIAWLAHRLASLHDDDNKIIFDNIIICTDRVIVDRQLQQAVLSLDHKSGLIRVMDDKCNSADLGHALMGNTKIIVTTIQKFPYVMDNVAGAGLANKTFAVIIDEAHSSTAGKNMSAVTYVLSEGELYEEDSADMEDIIIDEIRRNGKQKNVSMFAFTATPKPTTLQLFGRLNTKGQREAFHIYSMKQAIEEGFILNVLQNYVTYNTYYQLNKAVEEDPNLKTREAKRQIARFVDLHETNIAQRTEVIVEHFRTTVMSELGGRAKAMVVTASREAAVKYRQSFEDYLLRKGYNDVHTLVAFSGKVTVDEKEYTEAAMNGFAESRLPAEFDTDNYQILLVADKYQTGFDQKKLCAMYIMKKLTGVSTVQTLSRLNRICPPFDKHTFVLDFVNDYDDITRDFSKYYTTTLLSNSVTVSAVYDIEAKLDGYYVIDPSDVECYNELLRKDEITNADKKKMEFYLQKTKRTIENARTPEEKDEIILTVRHFVRCYEFLIQVTSFEDVELHKKYLFLCALNAYLKISSHGGGFNINGLIEASGFAQKKEAEYKQPKVNANPIVKLPVAEQIVLKPAKQERLSEIIKEINSRTGKEYDSDVTIKAMLQIRDILMRSEELKASALNNTEKDFEFAFFDNIDDALIEGLNQNQDFFTLLLQNEDIKKEVLGIFAGEIYKSLREDSLPLVAEDKEKFGEED